MFTGLIEATGSIINITQTDVGAQFCIQTPSDFLHNVKLGESICVQGTCLTVIEFSETTFTVELSKETLDCTSLADLKPHHAVNLERALLPTTRLGGHLVTGHVDSIGKVVAKQPEGEHIRLRFLAPKALTKYIARKGSICIDGVSLTVNEVNNNTFGVNLIPHTWQNTTLGQLSVGSTVNIEIDLLARYAERLLTCSKQDAMVTAS